MRECTVDATLILGAIGNVTCPVCCPSCSGHSRLVLIFLCSCQPFCSVEPLPLLSPTTFCRLPLLCAYCVLCPLPLSPPVQDLLLRASALHSDVIADMFDFFTAVASSLQNASVGSHMRIADLEGTHSPSAVNSSGHTSPSSPFSPSPYQTSPASPSSPSPPSSSNLQAHTLASQQQTDSIEYTRHTEQGVAESAPASHTSIDSHTAGEEEEEEEEEEQEEEEDLDPPANDACHSAISASPTTQAPHVICCFYLILHRCCFFLCLYPFCHPSFLY